MESWHRGQLRVDLGAHGPSQDTRRRRENPSPAAPSDVTTLAGPYGASHSGRSSSRSSIPRKEDRNRHVSTDIEGEDCDRPCRGRAHAGRRRCVCRREREQHHYRERDANYPGLGASKLSIIGFNGTTTLTLPAGGFKSAGECCRSWRRQEHRARSAGQLDRLGHALEELPTAS